MSVNGNILSGIIERNALCVVNGLRGIVKGVITQKRVTKINTEASAIDMVIVSSDMVEHIVKMHIDEGRSNVLTSLTNTNKGVVKHESDHNSITTQFNINWTQKDKPKGLKYLISRTRLVRTSLKS